MFFTTAFFHRPEDLRREIAEAQFLHVNINNGSRLEHIFETQYCSFSDAVYAQNFLVDILFAWGLFLRFYERFRLSYERLSEKLGMLKCSPKGEEFSHPKKGTKILSPGLNQSQNVF